MDMYTVQLGMARSGYVRVVEARPGYVRVGPDLDMYG